MTAAVQSYDSSNLIVLEGLEAIQKRPGMYIGSVDDDGVQVCLGEAIDNAIDEAMNGHGDVIDVFIDAKQGTMRVVDRGRGIPVGEHPKFKGMSGLEVVMTKPHSGGKFSTEYGVAGGLHGTGVKVITALSLFVTVVVKRDGHSHTLEFLNAKVRGKLKSEPLPRGRTAETGTDISFGLDARLFPDAASVVVSEERVRRTLRSRAYLNPGLKLHLRYDGKKSEEFFEPDGMAAFVREAVGPEALFPKACSLDNGDNSGIRVFVGLGWSSGHGGSVQGFCNSILQPDGGTHVQGLQMGLPGVVRNYVVANKMIPAKESDLTIEPKDCWEGVHAIVAVRHREPVFKGQSKSRLSNGDAMGAVQRLVNAKLAQWMEENPKEARCVASKAVTAARARTAAARAREQVRKADSGGWSKSFGKLADCSGRNPEDNELFVCEGDSAGGSAKMGRDRRTQAVYPLKGKPLNTWEKAPQKIMENTEISDLASALGMGPFADGLSEEEINTAVQKLRYHKIICIADADIDGCLAGETMILTTEGPVSIRELAERAAEGEPPATGYAMGWSREQVEVPLVRPHMTKRTQRMVRVRLGGNEEFVTPNHQFLLKDGTYVAAEDLLPGMDVEDGEG
jgi:DNA gyrase subunit B